MKVALVTAIGSYSADIVIKNLKKIDFKVIGTDIYAKEWVADAFNVNEFYQVSEAVDREIYYNVIKDICEKECITHIIPSTDIEVDFFCEYRDNFEEKGISICLSSYETLKICRNKKELQEFIDVNVAEIKAIPACYVSEKTDAPFEYPMVAKPYDGRSSRGVRRLYTKEDWEAVKVCEHSEKYIVQPMIKGKVVTVDIVRNQDGTTVVALPRLELLRTQNGAGMSVKVFPDRKLEQACKKLANALKIIGCVNFEFIRDEDGEYHFLECNPRFSGGVEFSCLAGYDCIGNHIRCFEKEEIDYFELTREMYIARKFEEYVTKVQ